MYPDVLEMRKPYKTPIVKAFPDLKIPEPRISKRVVLLLRLFTRLYLFLFMGVAKVVLQGDNYLFDAFKRAMEGKSRCILAFRHPNGGEPQLLTWFFLFKLKRLAARKGVRFPQRPHAVFVYGYEVVRWGGWVARFIMPGVGAMPIYYAKLDSKSMSRIFNTIVEGPYPLALAPEGKITYSTDTVPKLEPGVIRIGFQAAERLAGKDAHCPVEILPLSVHFRFGSWGHLTLEWLMRKTEKTCGIPRKGRKKLPFAERVRQCSEHILEVNEARYQIKGDASLPFEKRLEKVVYAALETAERMVGTKSDGDILTRMHRVNQVCWDRIYIPGVEDFKDNTQVEQNIKDLQAGEAWYAKRHIELVDFAWYFCVPPPAEKATLHEKVEHAQNLWDFANRTMGGGIKNRWNIFPRRVILQAAPAINLSERLPAYKNDKKATVAATLTDLEKAYRECIDVVANVKDFFNK